MTNKELLAKFNAFVEAQDASHMEEWYCTERDRAREVVRELKVYLRLAPDTRARISELEAEIAKLRAQEGDRC